MFRCCDGCADRRKDGIAPRLASGRLQLGGGNGGGGEQFGGVEDDGMEGLDADRLAAGEAQDNVLPG